LLSAGCLSWAGPASAESVTVCPAVPVAPLLLPATRAAIDAGRPVIIVALGSSSSRGAGASDPAHSYPSVLQAQLHRLLPMAEIAVINRGIDGEDARLELERLQADVLALRPTLVIWQVGANGAMAGNDPTVFEDRVKQGVSQLLAAGIDVILMDNQRSPRILASADHGPIEAALADAARATKTNLFSRGALMDGWRERGFAYGQFVSADGLHHNDRGYRCVAEALAGAITAATLPRQATR
jgi:acyl-CoA thioesterase I